jgi:hypothetical protein
MTLLFAALRVGLNPLCGTRMLSEARIGDGLATRKPHQYMLEYNNSTATCRESPITTIPERQTQTPSLALAITSASCSVVILAAITNVLGARCIWVVHCVPCVELKGAHASHLVQATSRDYFQNCIF